MKAFALGLAAILLATLLYAGLVLSQNAQIWRGHVPIVPLRRQIVVTTPLKGIPEDFPFVLDFSRSLYFHREGKGILTMRTYSLPDEERIGLEIADTGCGIHSENLTRIFDPFFTTKDVGKGSGLGLFIVHEIIEEHDGCIAVDSVIGEGTTFLIRLPLQNKDGRTSERAE